MVAETRHWHLFANTKARENLSQQIIGGEFTGNLGQRLLRQPQVFRAKLEALYLLTGMFHIGSRFLQRNNMALASFYAGAAFTRAYVGYVHAIAHNLGGLYGVPHGLANAVILPHVLEFCRKEAEKKLAKLAIAGGIGKKSESDEDLSHKFIKKIKAMNKKMKIPTFIKEIQEEDIPLIAKRALDEAHPDYPVPKIMTRKECETLVRKLMR